MQTDDTNTTDVTNASEPIGYADDTHVMRFLLHTIKGISPVSGGVMGDTLEQEYAVVEDEAASEQ